MNAFDYYLHCWKNYATFTGRARRSEFWFFQLFNYLISLGLGILGAIFNEITGIEVFSVFSTLYGLAVFIPNLAVAVRRLHDTNHSGWWVLAYYVPGIITFVFLIVGIVQVMSQYSFYTLDQIEPEDLPWGAITGFCVSGVVAFVFLVLLLVWMCTNSQPGANKYGANPKEIANGQHGFQQSPYGGYQQPNSYQQPPYNNGNPYQQDPNGGGHYQQ